MVSRPRLPADSPPRGRTVWLQPSRRSGGPPRPGRPQGTWPPPRRRAWGRYRPDPPDHAALQRRPVQGAAALQQHAVDLLRAEAVHQGGQVHMAVPRPAGSTPGSPRPHRGRRPPRPRAVARMVGISRAVRTMRLVQRGAQMGVADDADGVAPALHPAGQQGVVRQNGAHPGHDGPVAVPVAVDLLAGRLAGDPLGGPVQVAIFPSRVMAYFMTT